MFVYLQGTVRRNGPFRAANQDSNPGQIALHDLLPLAERWRRTMFLQQALSRDNPFTQAFHLQYMDKIRLLASSSAA